MRLCTLFQMIDTHPHSLTFTHTHTHTHTHTLLVQQTTDRLWELCAASLEEAQKWCTTLITQMAEKYPEGKLASLGEEQVNVLPGLDVWLYKKGEGLGALSDEKRRFFVLQETTGTKALRIAYFAPGPDGKAGSYKGRIPIYPSSTIAAKGGKITIVCVCVCVKVRECGCVSII